MATKSVPRTKGGMCMLVKNEYFKVLELLDDNEYRMIDISKELGVGIDMVKKLSQVKNIREQFQNMNLNEEDNEFLYSLWFNIIYLKDIDNKKDIEAIIRFLKSKSSINKDLILISKFCLLNKKEKISEIDREIKSCNRQIEDCNKDIDEIKALAKKFLDVKKEVDKALEGYDEAKRVFLKDMIGIRKERSYFSNARYILIMRYNVSMAKFRELKRRRAINYCRSGYYCEIINIDIFAEIMSNARKNSIDSNPRTKDIVALTEIKEYAKAKDIKAKIKDIKKEIKNYELRKEEELKLDLADEFEEVSKKYFVLKEFLENKPLTDIPRPGYLTDDDIYAENVFDIKRSHFVVSVNNEVSVYVYYPEGSMTHFIYTNDLEIFKPYIKSVAESRANYIVNKLKKHSDKIYLGGKLAHEGVITDEARELTRFNIFRKLNKEFLFLE